MSGEHLDIDPMLFFALVIEDQIAVLDMFTTGAAGFPVPGLADGVADIARNQIASAQAELDTLIAADDTWRDSYGTWCEMTEEPIGNDPEDGDYFRCTVHGKEVLGDAYICEGYEPPPYTGGH